MEIMNKKIFYLIILWGILVLPLIQVHAQGDSEKKPVKISLSYILINDQLPVLKVTTKIKTGKKFEPLRKAEVTIFFNEELPQAIIGKVQTNEHGFISLELPKKIISKLDSLSPIKFIGVITASDQFDEERTEIEITRARIELSLTEADSVKKISAKVLEFKDNKWTEVPKAEVKLFVRRLFSDLQVGESSYATDESGVIASEFNMKVPGDAMGSILVGAKIEDSDTYGTIYAMKSMNWGIPTKDDNSFAKRTLWASRDKTPYWLLITPNVIIVTVWGFIFYLFYLIWLIRKHDPAESHD
jgi:hypothetical protein